MVISRTNRILFSVGAILMSVPGLMTYQLSWLSLSCLVVGFLILLLATVMSSKLGPHPALALLIVSNLSFWGCYALWFARIHLSADQSGFVEEGAVQGIGGTIAFWCIFLCVFFICEAVILCRAIFSNQQRRLAYLSVLFVLAQIPLTLRFAYEAVQGV
jgi:hypothetical protein